MSMSLGLASFPADGNDADALLSEADRRMYAAKNQKKALLNGAGADEAADSVTSEPLTTK